MCETTVTSSGGDMNVNKHSPQTRAKSKITIIEQWLFPSFSFALHPPDIMNVDNKSTSIIPVFVYVSVSVSIIIPRV